jgi:prophage antirepressor-like protein
MIEKGVDELGNRFWVFNGKRIRADEGGPKPMLCLKDGFEANGLQWGGLGGRSGLKEHRGVMKFITPGGMQTLTTITPQGFNLLIMRGNKPFSNEFRSWLAEILTELGEKGQVSLAPAVTTTEITGARSPADLLIQQMQMQLQTIVLLRDGQRQLEDSQRQLSDGQRQLSDDHRQLEVRVDRIEEEKQESLKELMSHPLAKVPAPVRRTRRLLVSIVRSYCKSIGISYKAGFGILYKAVYYDLEIDLQARQRHQPGKNQMDLLEESGHIEEAYAIACDIFRHEPKIAS